MNAKIRTLFGKLSQDQRGLSTVEYVLLLVLLVVMCVGVWNTFGRGIARKLANAGGQFNTGTNTNTDATAAESTQGGTAVMTFQAR